MSTFDPHSIPATAGELLAALAEPAPSQLRGRIAGHTGTAHVLEFEIDGTLVPVYLEATGRITIGAPGLPFGYALPSIEAEARRLLGWEGASAAERRALRKAQR